MPPSQGGQRPQNFWNLVHVHTPHEKNNQILHGDQTRCEEKFYMVNHYYFKLLL